MKRYRDDCPYCLLKAETLCRDVVVLGRRDNLIGGFHQGVDGYPIFHASFGDHCRVYPLEEVALEPGDVFRVDSSAYDIDA